MKIPLQEKLAELESRIEFLELVNNVTHDQQAYWRGRKSVSKNLRFSDHWDKMWEHFHLAMKEIFGR